MRFASFSRSVTRVLLAYGSVFFVGLTIMQLMRGWHAPSFLIFALFFPSLLYFIAEGWKEICRIRNTDTNTPTRLVFSWKHFFFQENVLFFATLIVFLIAMNVFLIRTTQVFLHQTSQLSQFTSTLTPNQKQPKERWASPSEAREAPSSESQAP